MLGANKVTAIAALAFFASAMSAQAGGSNTYSTGVVEGPSITTYTAAQPVLETFGAPIAQPIEAIPFVEPTYVAPAAPIYQPAPVYVEPEPVVRDRAFYNAPRHGGNAQFGYQQSSACGGVLDGEHCLVILNDHMRRLRLERDAGTILIGNPLIADVTVLGKDTIFVSARSIGSTNLIALDKEGNEIVTYEIFVREPRTKRVTLRNLDAVETYQCAPNCLRALTQSDTPAQHSARLGVVSADIGIDQQAVGFQTGPAPTPAPTPPSPGAAVVPIPGNQGAAPAAASVPAPQAAAPSPAAGTPAAGLAASVALWSRGQEYARQSALW